MTSRVFFGTSANDLLCVLAILLLTYEGAIWVLGFSAFHALEWLKPFFGARFLYHPRSSMAPRLPPPAQQRPPSTTGDPSPSRPCQLEADARSCLQPLARVLG